MMDPEVRRQLKIHVERCVRPIRAANLRKDRMRRELFSHLTEVYAQEQLRLDDDQQALERTFERFGRVERVRQDLQSSVASVEQFLFQPLEPKSSKLCIRRQPSESAFQFTLRQGAVVGLAFFAALSLMAIFSIVTAVISGAELRNGMAHRYRMMFVTAAVGGLLIFAGLFANYLKVSAILQHGFFSRQSAAATITAVLGLTALVLVLLGACNAMNRVRIFPISSPTFVFWCALISGTIFEFSSMLSILDRKRSDEWDSLEIEPQ